MVTCATVLMPMISPDVSHGAELAHGGPPSPCANHFPLTIPFGSWTISSLMAESDYRCAVERHVPASLSSDGDEGSGPQAITAPSMNALMISFILILKKLIRGTRL